MISSNLENFWKKIGENCSVISDLSDISQKNPQNSIFYDFMKIYGILLDFFVIPGSLDITEHVPQLSLEISHNFSIFCKISWNLALGDTILRSWKLGCAWKYSSQKNSGNTTWMDLSFAPSPSKIHPVPKKWSENCL